MQLPSFAISSLALLAVASTLAGCPEPTNAPAGPDAAASSSPKPTSAPSAPTSSAPAPTSSATAAPADAWFRVTKSGHELGVVEVLSGKPWRVVLHSGNDDAKALDELVTQHGAKPIALDMHLPAEKPGERGPHGSEAIAPGDRLYGAAVQEHLRRKGFDVSGAPPRFDDPKPPPSISKLELSRDGALVGTLDLKATPPALQLVNREGNALFLETFWQGLAKEDRLVVSYLSSEAGKDKLVTVSANKGAPDYPQLVRVAFAVRYPAYTVKVIP